MSSIDPKRSWDDDQGNGIADLTGHNCHSPEKRMKRSSFGTHIGFDSEHIFEAPIGAPSSSSSSSWINAHGLLASPNPFFRNDMLETPRGESGLSPKTPKSDFRFFVDILSPLALGTSPTTSLPQSEMGKNFPSSKDWSPFVGGFAAVGEEFSFSEIATNSHQPIRFSPKIPQLRSANQNQSGILHLGSHGYNAEEAISPTSTERSFNMMDEQSSPHLTLGLDNDSNEHFVSNKQALAARLGGGNGTVGSDTFGNNSSRESKIFAGLHLRGDTNRYNDRGGEGVGTNTNTHSSTNTNTSSSSSSGYEIPGIAAITAAAEAVDDHKGMKDTGNVFSSSGATGKLHPQLLICLCLYFCLFLHLLIFLVIILNLILFLFHLSSTSFLFLLPCCLLLHLFHLLLLLYLLLLLLPLHLKHLPMPITISNIFII